MKCISKRAGLISLILSAVMLLSGCGSSSYDLGYDPNSSDNSFLINASAQSENLAEPFAENLCVTDNNLDEMALAIDEAEAGGLFDATTAETIYAKNVHARMNPASITKVMTAYIALKYGNLGDTLTASSNVLINESGAVLLGIKEGDKMTLEQALNALLIYSANDAAVMIAEYVSGSTESFAQVMNDEALKLGATNTHFVNPNGLTDENHYTTAYDLYLIFNAAMQYEEFRKIINTAEYKSEYKDVNGNPKEIDIASTNGYLTGSESAPSNITVIGGKTGTTNAAGACLILLSNSASGDTYISVILHSEDHDSLYRNMTDLLSDIP